MTTPAGNKPSTIVFVDGDVQEWDHVRVNDHWLWCMDDGRKARHINRDLVREVIRNYD